MAQGKEPDPAATRRRARTATGTAVRLLILPLSVHGFVGGGLLRTVVGLAAPLALLLVGESYRERAPTRHSVARVTAGTLTGNELGTGVVRTVAATGPISWPFWAQVSPPKSGKAVRASLLTVSPGAPASGLASGAASSGLARRTTP